MVTAEDKDAVGVLHLETDEKRGGLDRVVASVHIVAHEQIVRIGERTSCGHIVYRIK